MIVTKINTKGSKQKFNILTLMNFPQAIVTKINTMINAINLFNKRIKNHAIIKYSKTIFRFNFCDELLSLIKTSSLMIK